MHKVASTTFVDLHNLLVGMHMVTWSMRSNGAQGEKDESGYYYY